MYLLELIVSVSILVFNLGRANAQLYFSTFLHDLHFRSGLA